MRQPLILGEFADELKNQALALVGCADRKCHVAVV
jgi:hypothetical protein